MGTDIHMIVEVRKNGKWEMVETPIFPSVYGSKYPKTNIPYDGRNYTLFSMLANIRNSKRGEPEYVHPIKMPRGLPKDLSDKAKEALYDGEGWLFGYSYLTLKELYDYDWAQIHCDVGFVSLRDYESMMKYGDHPSSWSAGVCGGNVKIVTEKEMKDIIEGVIPKENGKEYYCRCVMPGETYAEEAGCFYTVAMPIMKRFGKPKDVRIVFGFDC